MEAMQHRFEEPRALKGQVADHLRERIASGDLPLGAQLSDKHLSEEMRISRTPVREALLQLRSEGLVVMRPQRGTYVFDVTPAEIKDICQVRSVFETGALRIVAKDELPHLLETLNANVIQAASALRRRNYVACEKLDTQFHESIIALCGNRLLATTYKTVSDKVRALRSTMPKDPDRFSDAVQEHRRLVTLLQEGKVAEAIQLLDAHVRNVYRLLTADSGSMKAIA